VSRVIVELPQMHRTTRTAGQGLSRAFGAVAAVGLVVAVQAATSGRLHLYCGVIGNRPLPPLIFHILNKVLIQPALTRPMRLTSVKAKIQFSDPDPIFLPLRSWIARSAELTL